MQELIATLLQAILVVATPILAAYLVKLLNAKAEQAKEAAASEVADRYIAEAADAVTNAVLYMSQTYVDKLKESDQWTTANQKAAFTGAVDRAKTVLSDSAKRFIDSAYGDLTLYLGTMVEAEVKIRK